MSKTITIAPVTRIEGHAKVTIQLDDAGNVADTTVNVVELRGFEKFCLGRPVEEMPRITTSICGVCPWSHHLASAKANDAVFGVTPPPTGAMLRDLCDSIAYCEEHILHFYFLAGADFVMGPEADSVGPQRHRHRQGQPGARQAGGAHPPPRGPDAQHRLREVDPPGHGRAGRLLQAAHRGRSGRRCCPWRRRCWSSPSSPSPGPRRTSSPSTWTP